MNSGAIRSWAASDLLRFGLVGGRLPGPGGDSPQAANRGRGRRKRQAAGDRGERSGVAATEFALTFPIAMGLFVSLATLIQAFVIRNAAENAAYFGARKGITPGATTAEISQVVDRELKLAFIANYEHEINRSGGDVTVRVVVPFQGNLWTTAGLSPKSLVIEQRCTLKKQEK